MVYLLLEGLLIGFAIAMPVGPIGMMCIRNTLNKGMIVGLATGLGAACADAVFGGIAGFGISSVSEFLLSHQNSLKFFGGLFLIYLGITIWRSKTVVEEKELQTSNLLKVFLSTFVLTLTNPLTILSFTGAYAVLKVEREIHSFIDPLLLTLGVFIGSTLWWILLCCSSLLFKQRMRGKAAIWLNKVSGALIACFGIVAVVV